MKDPDTTKFRSDFLTRDGWLCGEVNSRNEFGAYAGFKKFMSNAKSGHVFLEGEGRIDRLAADRTTTEVIDRIDREIAILKRHNASSAAGLHTTPLSNIELHKISTQEIFDQNWAEHCRPNA